MTYKNEEFAPCGECADGYIYETEETVKKCNCLLNYQKRQRLRLSLHKANIPHDTIIDYNIRHYIKGQSYDNVKKLKFYVDNFIESFSDKQLYMWGKPGTQKTTLSFWIGKELIKRGCSVYYILMNDLVKDLQREGFEETTDLSKYYNVDCLIIDRAFVGDQVTLYKSGYQIPFLDNFLRKRIDQLQKAIIFISNADVDSISINGFGEDIQDLIIRKTKPYGSVFEFKDHYTLKDDFNTINLWGDK